MKADKLWLCSADKRRQDRVNLTTKEEVQGREEGHGHDILIL